MTQITEYDEILKDFVLSYVKKSRQERLLTELLSPKKRSKGLDRFCHQSEDLLRKDRIVFQGTDLKKCDKLPSLLKKEKQLVLFSCDPAFDQLVMEPEEALAYAFYCQDMLIMAGENMAIVYEEVYTRGQTKYLLRKENKER